MKLLFAVFISIILSFYSASVVNAQVRINEFSSFESSGDWVELYATEDTDISGWILRDNSESEIETIPQGTTIGPSTAPFYIIEAGNRLNKEEDLIKLLKSDNTTLVDSLSYGTGDGLCKPEQGQSAGRVDNGSTIERFSSPTKNATNVGAGLSACPTPTPAPVQTPTPTPDPTPTPTPVPTPTPTPSKSPTPRSTSFPAKNPFQTPGILGEVAGLRYESPEPESSGTPQAMQKGVKKSFPVIGFVLIGSGILFMGIAGYMIYKNRKKMDASE